jgi:hypothetical protein
MLGQGTNVLVRKWGQKENPRFMDFQWLSLENPTNIGFDTT